MVEGFPCQKRLTGTLCGRDNPSSRLESHQVRAPACCVITCAGASSPAQVMTHRSNLSKAALSIGFMAPPASFEISCSLLSAVAVAEVRLGIFNACAC